MSTRHLDTLFRPDTVALIGAHARPGGVLPVGPDQECAELAILSHPSIDGQGVGRLLPERAIARAAAEASPNPTARWRATTGRCCASPLHSVSRNSRWRKPRSWSG